MRWLIGIVCLCCASFAQAEVFEINQVTKLLSGSKEACKCKEMCTCGELCLCAAKAQTKKPDPKAEIKKPVLEPAIPKESSTKAEPSYKWVQQRVCTGNSCRLVWTKVPVQENKASATQAMPANKNKTYTYQRSNSFRWFRRR